MVPIDRCEIGEVFLGEIALIPHASDAETKQFQTWVGFRAHRPICGDEPILAQPLATVFRLL